MLFIFELIFFAEWIKCHMYTWFCSAIWLVPPEQGGGSRQFFLRMLPGSPPRFWGESLGTRLDVTHTWSSGAEIHVGTQWACGELCVVVSISFVPINHGDYLNPFFFFWVIEQSWFWTRRKMALLLIHTSVSVSCVGLMQLPYRRCRREFDFPGFWHPHAKYSSDHKYRRYWNPRVKYAEGFWHPAVHPLGN